MGNDNKNNQLSQGVTSVTGNLQTGYPQVTPKLPPDQQNFTTNEVAKIFGVTKQAIIKWRKNGKLTADSVDKQGVYWYSRDNLEKLLVTPSYPQVTGNQVTPKLPPVTGNHQPPTETKKIFIPEYVVQQINSISPEDLALHGVITESKTSVGDKPSYNCICGNGTGEDGTGIVPSLKGNTWIYHCFKCGKTFNNIHLLAFHYGLDSRSDFQEICRKTCDDFGIFLDSSPVTSNTEKIVATETKEQDLIDADIVSAFQNIDNLPENKRRGLSLDTLKYFHCGYISDWTSPKSRITGTFATPSPRLIIPSGNHYLARLLVPISSFNSKSQKYIKEKQHAGKKFPFNFNSISFDTPNIVVEGEIDAMSIWQATEGKFPVVATGGATGFKEFVKLLKENFKNNAVKPSFIVLFDPDDTGRNISETFVNALINAKFPAVSRFFDDDISKIDANDILRQQGNDKLAEIVNHIVANSHDDLTKIATDIQNGVANDIIDVKDLPPEMLLSPEQYQYIFKQIKGYSDLANARRLTFLFGDQFRYLSDIDTWARYYNNIWNIDSNSKNSSLFPLVVQAADILSANSKSSADKKIASSFANHKKFSPAVSTLKGIERIIITSKDFDNHKNLLNCENGIVDLETGILYPHSSSFLITQKVNAVYKPNYHNDTVDKFLCDIQPNDDTRAALLRFLGYAITGETCEEKFLFIDGKGGNGKGTLTGLLLYLLDSYACSFPIKAILLGGRTDANAATPAFNILVNKHVGISEEIPPDGKLDTAILKLLTGRDRLYIRLLNHEASCIDNPTWTLIFSGNNLPIIKDALDIGIIRRLLNIKFQQDFTGDKCDPTLKGRLLTKDSLSAFLSILVENSIEWYKNGLLISSEMKDAANRYIESQDFISEFIAEHCTRNSNSSIRRRDFLKSLRDECPADTSGLSDRSLTSIIEKVDGIEYKRDRDGVWTFRGIEWNDPNIQEQQSFSAFSHDIDVPF